MRKIVERWRVWARSLQVETYALYLAYRDPRTPWYARLWAIVVVAYALSPIDLIPDPIPVLGYLDDLILVPLGILIAVRLIPAEVFAACRDEARREMLENSALGKRAAAVIVVIWLLSAALLLLAGARWWLSTG